MPAFWDREAALDRICVQTDQVILVNIFGEAGIGKSCLLQEAAHRLRAKYPPALVLQVDLDPVASISANRPEAAVRALVEHSEGWLSGIWPNVEQVAGQLVARLIELAGRMQVVLMFDTTEVLQEDMDFWRWMEANLVVPLAVDGQVRQIFAGRVPVPWRKVEVRRALQLLPLGPLAPEEAAKGLIRQVLQTQNPGLEDRKNTDDAIGLVLGFSFGHPLLSEKLAVEVAPCWPTSSLGALGPKLCEQVIKPFIEQNLFEGVEYPWDEILWWASVLEWFDVTVLRRYLGRVAPALIEGKPDFFFIQGITRLRIRNAVVWSETRGDRLYGVFADILRRCMEVSTPEAYRRACRAAAETFETLAGEFPEEHQEFRQYRQEAESYRQRVERGAEE
jgi:hypothetical protein